MFWKENTFLWENAGKILLWLYLVGSFIFIVLNVYMNLKVVYGDSKFAQWANTGYAQAVSEVIQRAQECKPFPVYSGRNQEDVIGVELINIACLQGDAPTQEPAQKWEESSGS